MAFIRSLQGRLVGALTSGEVVPDSPRVRSFLEDAVQWLRTASQAALLRLLRSPYSGVDHDVAAAYATLVRRGGVLLEAIDRGQLALPPNDRDAVLQFAQRMRRIRALPEDLESDALREAIRAVFDLTQSEDRVSRAPQSADTGEFALAVAAPTEDPRGVPARPKHFSASALNMYVECARRWFYKYVCTAVEDRGSAASAYGTAFHLALEDFHGEFPRPTHNEESAMRRRVGEFVTWAFERNRPGFGTRVEFELAVRRAQRTAQRYVDWLLVQEKEAPFEVLGREVAAELDLEGRAFIGYIDRLDRDVRSGEVAVVDYKTGSIATSVPEYAERVRRFRDFQLPFYYLARTAAGDKVTKLVLIPLKDALLDVRPIVVHVGRNIEVRDLERSRARMVELSDELSSGTIEHFAPTHDPSPCGYCAYAIACAARPSPEARRFGS